MVMAVAGCGGPSDEERFQQAEDMIRNGQFLDAIPVLKQYLLRHPHHSGAHLYLGICYMLSDKWIALAEGEIRTALYLYRRDGERSTIPRFSGEYFKARCYMELIKASLLRYDAAFDPRMPPDILETAVEGLRNAIDEALREVPDNAEIRAIAEQMPELEAKARATLDRRFPMYRSRRNQNAFPR